MVVRLDNDSDVVVCARFERAVRINLNFDVAPFVIPTASLVTGKTWALKKAKQKINDVISLT